VRPGYLKLITIPLLLAACSEGDTPIPSTTPAPASTAPSAESSGTIPTPRHMPVEFDCPGDSGDCPALAVVGDEPATLPNGRPSPFRGISDPTIQRDPESARLWLAYSRPSIHVTPDGPTTRVESYLAHSDDAGQTWHSDGVLWAAREVTNPLTGDPGYMDTEVPNFLPATIDGELFWFGARLELFVPSGRALGQRPVTSFRIRVSVAESPAALATAEAQSLGGAGTAPAWGIDQRLSDLDSSLQHCIAWNEPALLAEGRTLYLALRCLALSPAGTPDVTRSPLVVFATEPTGVATSWKWRYIGQLAGAEEAAELGGRGLTQIDFARSRDGTLLCILTPDDWSAEHGEFVHYGIRVVELESIAPPALKRHPTGQLLVRAIVTASDQDPLGPGAAAYAPDSETGLLLMRRVISDASLIATVHATGVHP